MKHALRQYAPLIALLALALFPFGWLTHLSPLADALGETFFPNEAAHAVGHTVLFAALGVALLSFFPALRRRPAGYLGVVLAIAVAQEGIQLLYKQRPVVLNDITDIGVDLVAAGLVWALWYIKTKDDRRKTDAAPHHAQAPGRRG